MNTAEAQLQVLIERYSPEVADRARASLAKLRKILPGATQLVYDNYNALAVAFSLSGRPSDAILSLTLYPRWVSLFFTRGAALPDPHHLLKGSGNRMRHLVLNAADELDQPEIRSLIDEAVRCGGGDRSPGNGGIIIQAISAKQRPRRPC